MRAGLPAGSPLADCRPGDRLWVREAFVYGRTPEGEAQDVATARHTAEFVAFPDGWRRDPTGREWRGDPPKRDALIWTPGVHMPRWASRAGLLIDAVTIEPLHAMRQADFRAEGLEPLLCGLLWRWPRPIAGLWLRPERAYAARWNALHGKDGQRWRDNPEALVLRFRLVQV